VYVLFIGELFLNHLTKTVTNEHIRLMIRSVDLSHVFDVMSGHDVVNQTVQSLNEKLSEYGLAVQSMAIENISIPEEFAEILSKTTEWNIKQKYEQQFHNFKINSIENESIQLLTKLQSESSLYVM
jgi:hypothetical protein